MCGNRAFLAEGGRAYLYRPALSRLRSSCHIGCVGCNPIDLCGAVLTAANNPRYVRSRIGSSVEFRNSLEHARCGGVAEDAKRLKTGEERSFSLKDRAFGARPGLVVLEKSRITLDRECAVWTAAAKPSSSYEQVKGAIAQPHGFPARKTRITSDECSARSRNDYTDISSTTTEVRH